jgi:hypothetical protein
MTYKIRDAVGYDLGENKRILRGVCNPYCKSLHVGVECKDYKSQRNSAAKLYSGRQISPKDDIEDEELEC